ncbi:MAG: hypothetical protein IJ733_09430 [Lachnospiraceae bacterium]|nr:hypothetical protein [Lachnospiraceae bacterium]
MIYYNKQTLSEIRSEEKKISRNAGLLCSRIVLLFFLFLLFFSLRPTSVYLFTAFAFFPAIISWLFSRNEKAEKKTVLESCAAKYHFTYHHYIGEKYTGNFIILSLFLWQLILTGQETGSFILRNAPALCAFIYLATRFITTEIVKKKIHRYYGNLECLE